MNVINFETKDKAIRYAKIKRGIFIDNSKEYITRDPNYKYIEEERKNENEKYMVIVPE